MANPPHTESFSIGGIKVSFSSMETVDSMPCSTGEKGTATASIYELTHPEGWKLKIAHVDFGHDRHIGCLEYSHDSPLAMHRLTHGLRLGVHGHGIDDSFVELRQARFKDPDSSWSTVKKVPAKELDEKAGFSIEDALAELGGAFGTREELIGDTGRRRTDLCTVFPDSEITIPIFAYVATRVLPLLPNGGKRALAVAADGKDKTVERTAKEDPEPNPHGTTPVEKIMDIKEGQTGISYKELFSDYLAGAKKIRIRDPYIRLTYQVMNLIDFCSIVEAGSSGVDIDLTTKPDPEFEAELTDKLNQLKDSLMGHGIRLDYRFDQDLHDRSIETDTGWRIMLGRGLDIYRKPDGRFSLGVTDQRKRRCKTTTISFHHVGTG